MTGPEESLAARIREELTKRERTGAWLSRKLGKPGPWLSRRLTGTTPFRFEDVVLIAAGLDMSVESLVRDGLVSEQKETPGDGPSEGSTSSSGDELGDEESVQSA